MLGHLLESLVTRQLLPRVTNSKAASAPTPDGFAFVPSSQTYRFLGRHRWVVGPASERRAAAFTSRPNLPFKEGRAGPRRETISLMRRYSSEVCELSRVAPATRLRLV
jgi:hypothetical protein